VPFSILDICIETWQLYIFNAILVKDFFPRFEEVFYIQFGRGKMNKLLF